MGRRKKNKPQRPRPPSYVRGPRPLGVYYDELTDFLIDPPVTLPPGNHTIGMHPTEDGVESRVYLEDGGHIDLPKAYASRSIGDGAARMEGADPITREELTEVLAKARRKGWMIPRDEEAEPFLTRLVELGLMEHDADRDRPHPVVVASTGYRVTVAGWAFLRRLLRCKTEDQLPPPLAPEMGTDWSDAEIEMVLCTWALADMFCSDDPELAARFRAEAMRERLNLLFPPEVASAD